MSNATSVRVSCPACRKRIKLPADVLHELGSKLTVQVMCSECGASRPVSVLRGLGRVVASAPVVSPPPFRPLLAPAPATEAAPPAPFAPLLPTKPAGRAAQAQPAPATKPTPAPAPVIPIQTPRSDRAPVPSSTPVPQQAFAPFAPIETANGHLPTEPATVPPSLADRWRKLRPAQRQQLAAVIALAILVGSFGGFKKWQRSHAESAEQPVAAGPVRPGPDTNSFTPPPSGRSRGEAPGRVAREPDPESTAAPRSGRTPVPAQDRGSRDRAGLE